MRIGSDCCCYFFLRIFEFRLRFGGRLGCVCLMVVNVEKGEFGKSGVGVRKVRVIWCFLDFRYFYF